MSNQQQVSELERESANLWLPEQVQQALGTPIATVAGADISGWTACHALAGFAFGSANVDFGASIAVHQAWEQWQSLVREHPEMFPDIVDRLFDTSAFVGGWIFSRYGR